MSSNIGPEAQAAYQRYLDATTLEDKIKKLEEFLSAIPKHKSTEKIVALNRSRLARLKREQEDKKTQAKSTAKLVSPFSIKKEGIQLILVSDYYVPGVGKTSLLNFLTGAAKEKIGRFTPLPEIGIYEYKKIRFQIVDMPSIMEGASTGIGNGKEIISQLRACDLICFCIDLSRDYQSQMDLILKELSQSNVRINISPPPISVEKTGSNKVQIFYLTNEAKKNEDIENLSNKIREIINENGIRNAIVKVFGEINLNQVVDAINPSVAYKKAIIMGTKGDLALTKDSFNNLKSDFSETFPLIIGTSVQKEEFPKNFGDVILKFLDKIRIYTMNQGVKAEKPLIMDSDPTPPTVKDIALRIHRSFYDTFDYATIIREGSLHKRKKVGLDYEMRDNDIIEIHTI